MTERAMSKIMEMSNQASMSALRLTTHSYIQFAAGKKRSCLIGPWENTPEQSVQQFIMHLTDD